MAIANCLPQVQACRMRIARLEDDGVPLPGGGNLAVTDALVTFDFSWVVDAGNEINEKTACGTTGVQYKAPDSLKRGDVKIQMLTPDPFVAELLSTGKRLTPSGDADARGFAAPPLGVVVTEQVSIEIWARRILNGKQATDYPWAWWVYPWVDNLRPDSHQHSVGNLPFSYVGQAHENDNWYNGPNNDWQGTSDRVYQWLPAKTIPDAHCGALTLAAS